MGGDVPEFFKKEPNATIVRDVISSNEEFFYFLELLREIDIDPVF